jgi:5,10-methenyltetrahydrofolate synthetase
MSELVSKRDLRRTVRSLLERSSAEERALWSRSICNHLDSLISDLVGLEGFVGVFSPMAIEPDIALWSLKLTASRPVCFPRMEDAPVFGEMRFFKVGGAADLIPEPRFGGRWLEPRPTCDEVTPGELAVVLVPFVALDSLGSRLGHGGGFYDRYLVRLRPDVVRVAVGFDLQRVPSLPSEDHDVTMDLLVTENGIQQFGRWRKDA